MRKSQETSGGPLPCPRLGHGAMVSLFVIHPGVIQRQSSGWDPISAKAPQELPGRANLRQPKVLHAGLYGQLWPTWIRNVKGPDNLPY